MLIAFDSSQIIKIYCVADIHFISHQFTKQKHYETENHGKEDVRDDFELF